MAVTASTLKPAIQEARKPSKRNIHIKEDGQADEEQTGLTSGISTIKVQDVKTSRSRKSNLGAGSSRDPKGVSRKQKTSDFIDMPQKSNEKQRQVSFSRQGDAIEKKEVSTAAPNAVNSLVHRAISPFATMFSKDDTVPGNAASRQSEAQKRLDLMNLKFKNKTIAEKTAKNWGKMEDTGGLGNFIGLKRQRSSINIYSNVEVLDALSTIQEQQKKREQERVKGQLDKIKSRVQRTLEDFGMDLDIDEEDTNAAAPSMVAAMFDTRAEREKIRERNYIIGKVEEFEEKALLKKQYLTELYYWFHDNIDWCSDVVTPEEMQEMIWNAQDLHVTISQSLEAFTKNAELVIEKGQQLLGETSRIVAERKAQMAKRMKKERIIVYDDKTLLQDPIKWEMAAKTIISVFEDSQKMIRNIMFKNALKLSQRQFEYMMEAAEKRYKDLDEKKKQCADLHGKLHTSKMQGDRMNREIEEQKRKMEKLLNELSDTKLSMEKLQARVKELNQVIAEKNSNIKFLEERLREKLKTPTPPPTPSPPPEPEPVIVKVVDSETELKLKDTEAELEASKAELKKLQDESRLVTEKLLSERELCKSLQERIQKLENIPTPEPVIIAAPPTPVVEAPLESDRDANYYKTLMMGMKNEHADEIEKFKAHVEKEKSRGEAGMRKMESQHKDQLSTIQKDILRMLRGIVHFRDRMMACLEKESLLDQAQALHDLGDFVKDKLSPDPRELLAVIVSTVIDYLHNMEGILYNSFKAMRIMMRYQIEKQVENEVEARMAKFKQDQEMKKVVKEVEKKQTVLTGAKKDVKHLAKRLKKAKNKLKKYQKDLETAPSDKRYKNLLQRYNHVITLYKNMCKEMEVLQSDFHDTMIKKLEEKETMVITQMKMEMKQQRAITEEQLKLSIRDKKENLHLLSKAYDDNKISQDLYKMASTMIRKAMDIPRLKLKNLFEQYITYRTVQESKDRVQKVLHEEDSDLLTDTRREMELYVEQMDKKFNSSMRHWRIRMKQLDFEKKDLNKRIFNVFNEVLLETGVLLIHPLLKDTSKRNIMAQATGTVTRKRMKQMLFKHTKKFKTFRDMPELIQGSAIPLQPVDQHNWTMTFRDMPELIQGSAIPLQPVDQRVWTMSNRPPAEPVPRVVAPHMLAYDVNGPRLQAVRKFKGTVPAHRRDNIDMKMAESFHINDRNILQRLYHFSGQRRPLNTTVFPQIL